MLGSTKSIMLKRLITSSMSRAVDNSTDSNQYLTQVAQLCFLARTKQGLKIDPVQFTQDSRYALEVLDQIQKHENVDENLLALSLMFSVSVSESVRKNALEKRTPDKPPEATPKPSKDYKFGPRG